MTKTQQKYHKQDTPRTKPSKNIINKIHHDQNPTKISCLTKTQQKYHKQDTPRTKPSKNIINKIHHDQNPAKIS
jgi:hypothetical protein